jgi:hypothetical protein
MVAFRHSDKSPKWLPSVSKYGKWVGGFKKAFGKRISAMGAWNEPNNGHEPTANRKGGTKRAADYAAKLRRDICKPPTCTAVAGEFQFRGKWKTFMTTYVNRIKSKATGASPTVWGAHPYGDVTRQDTTRLTYFQSNLPSSAAATWLTEVGAHIDALHVPQSANETGQSDRMKFLVNTEGRRNIMSAPPIKRLYYYGMWEQNSNGAQNFDTGLLRSGTGPGGGDPRMAYSVYSSHTHDHPRG